MSESNFSSWAKEKPEHWGLMRLGHLAKIYAGGTPDKSNSDYWGGSIPWLNSGTVNQWLITEASEYITDAGFRNSSARWIPKGSLLMALAGQGKTKGMTAQLGFDATCNQSVAAIIPVSGNNRYLLYWLSANYRNIRGMASDDLRDGLNLVMLGQIPIPVPPVDEQEAIAIYLDAETARIDDLIREKDELIELLKEWRQSAIAEAVTKGLHSDVALKNSRVVWLGMVPNHWDVKQIKRLSPVRRGASPRPIDDPIYFDDSGEYGWVRIEDVTRSNGVLNETIQYLSDLGASLSVKMQPGSLFMSIAGSVGKPCIAGRKVCIHDGFVYFPDLQIDPRWLFRLIESGLPFLGLGKLGTQLNLNTQTVGDVFIGIPPANEIIEILNYLDIETAKIDKLITHTTDEIALLKELRAATIADAVLGRIDVRTKQ